MTADWWSVKPAGGAERAAPGDPPLTIPPTPLAPPAVAPAPDKPSEPDCDEAVSSSSRARSKAVKVVGGVAGAVVAGALVLSFTSGGEGDARKSSTPVAAEQGGDLPPAGDVSPQGDLPAAGGGLAMQSREGGAASQGQAPSRQIVTLTAEPSGKGRVGAIVKVSIHNGTSEPLTVLASLVKGDGRPAVVGEGTLAPGSRVIEPGETARGTVEFAVSAAPHQVALLDLSGNMVAASD